jgi:uncharacterized protein DUF3999
VIAALVVLLAAATAAPAPPETPPTWTTRRAIVLPALAQSGFVEVPLDADVYRTAAPTLADLRVRERGGAEVGYVLRRHERAARLEPRALAPLDLVVTPARQARFVLDLGPRPPLHAGISLRLAADGRSYRVPVRVETSADRRAWDIARAAGFVYDVAGQTRAIDTSVTYPPSTARWLRVTIEPAGGVPLRVRGAAIVLETPAEREEEPVAATIVQREQDTPRKVSRLVLDLGGRHPVDRIDVDIADRNFHRVVVVEASEDRAAWRWVGSCAVSAVDTPRVRERQTATRLPETTARYLRLTIQNQDDRPLDITGVRLAAVRRSVVFEAMPDHEYVLDYGHPGAPAPRYDAERTVRFLTGERLPRATLGPPAPLPVTPPRRVPWLDAQPLAMWAAMAVAIVALGALLVRLARSVRASA